MNRNTLATSILFATLLAGCLSPVATKEMFVPQSDKITLFNGALTFHRPVAYNGSGLERPLPPGFLGENMPTSVEQVVPLRGGEPNIGVTSKGNLFVMTLDQAQRSTDHGKSWKVAWNYATPGAPTTDDLFSTLDPMLWIDPDTDRVFADQMNQIPFVGTCTDLAWSDQEGAPGSWTERYFDCGIPGIDHQKIITAHYGPGAPKPANPAYPNVVYLCTNDPGSGTACAESFDGGLSFPTSQIIEPPDYPDRPQCGNINGHEAAYPDGTVVVAISAAMTGKDPAKDCQRPLTVYVTETNGLGGTYVPNEPYVPQPAPVAPGWQPRRCAPGFGQVDVDPDITVTPDGTAYMVFRHNDQLTYLLRTKDKFQHCDVFKISPPGMKLGVFQAITSGDDGKVSMAWLGTRDEQKTGAVPSNATGGTRWSAYVTTSFDAESQDPTFVTQQVTPDEDPVQVGCVWLNGGGGGPHSCRNLADFIDMVTDKDGRTYVSITDGCVPRNGCEADPDSSEYQSRDTQVAVLVLDHGRGLRGDALLPSLGLSPPMPFKEEQ